MNTLTASSSVPAAPSGGRSLLRWLGRYVSKRRTFLTGMGFAAALAAAVLLCIGSSTLDVMFTLPAWLRWTVLTVTALALLWLCAAGIRRAINIRRRIAMDEIESFLPAHGQLMRTALDEALAPPSTDPARAMLAAGLIGQAGEIAQRFHPEKSLPWQKFRRRWLASLAAVGLLAVLFTSWRDFGTAVRRFLQPAANITFTQLAFIDAPKEIVAGNDCTVAVRLAGRSAPAPLLAIRRGDVPDEPLVMQRDASKPGVYFVSIGKPGAEVSLRATAGDGSTQELTIPVIHPPKLKEISATLTYPGYTGLKPASQKSPDVEAVEGTLVTMSVTTDRALDKGRVEFSDGTSAPLAFNGSVTTFTAPVLRGKLTWKLEASDQRGLKPSGAGGKWIGQEDKPPKIEWMTPKDDIEATPLAEVTLRAKAKDDFGLLETGVVIMSGSRQKTLMTQDFKDTDGVPVTAVADAIAAMEDQNVNIRDNVKVFAFARDRYPAPPGKERRGVSDLRNIDIRQFKVWRAMMNGGGGGMPPPKAQKALMKLEQIIKQQRGVVNSVFRFREENLKEPQACQEAAGRETKLSAGTLELKVALKESETPPPDDDLLLLDTAGQQMNDAATALEPMDLDPAWTSADGALTSLLELRREFMKIMSKNGKPCDCESKPDDFKMPSLTELAKEAERLAKEEQEVSKSVPLAKNSAADGDKLTGRQAAAQSDGGELFDKIVTHPEVTDLAQSRMEEAEKSMSAATRELRARQPDEALPPLNTARDSLDHLAQHLRGLDAQQAANTLKLASEMAKQSADGLKGEGEKKSEDGEGEGQGDGKNGETAGAKSDKQGKRSGESDAARDAATINDWLKNLARQESLGRTGERLGALQKDAKTDDLAKRLAELAGQAQRAPVTAVPGNDSEKQELAGQLEKLSEALDAEHQRLVQGTLEKLAAAQAAAKAMREAAKNGKPGNKAGDKPGNGKGQGDKPGEGKGNKPGEGKGTGQGQGAKPGDGQNGGGPGGGTANDGFVSPKGGQGWGLTENHRFSTARPGSLKFAEDFADMLKDFQDTELTELSEELLRAQIEKGYNRDVDPKTLGEIESRLEVLIQDVIQRQLLAGKSDRVPPDFEARVENYFRRLSEDTGDDEEEEGDGEKIKVIREFPFPSEFDPPQHPQSFPQGQSPPGRTLNLPERSAPSVPPRRVPPSGPDPFAPGRIPYQ